MTPVRWLLIFTTGLFILLATAAVQAFRLRDAPPKALASENLLKKIVPQAKCDSCDTSIVDNISPTIGKFKTPVIPTAVDKTNTNHNIPNKIDLTSKKGVQQIRPGFRIKVFKKDDSDDDDDDDDEDDDDDSDDDTDAVVDIENSEEESGDDISENDDKDSEDDDDSDEEDDEDSSGIDSKSNKKDSDTFSEKEVEVNESEDDDDSDESEEDEDDNDKSNDEDDESYDDDSDESEVEKSDDEDSGSERTDSDTDIDETVIVIKSNLRSSIKTVNNILKETSKISKPIPQTVKEINIKTELPQKKSEVHRDAPKKESLKLDSASDDSKLKPKPNIELTKEQAKSDIKKDIPAVSLKKESTNFEPKKEPVKSEAKKEDKKNAETKPELKKENVKTEPKKEEIKSETKKEPVKSETKNEPNKPESKKEQQKRHETPDHHSKHDAKVDVTKNDNKKQGESQKIMPLEVKSDTQKSRHESHDKKADLIKKDSYAAKISLERKNREHTSIIQEAILRKNLRESDFQDFYTFFPTFAPNFSRIHNPECRRQGQILVRQLKGAKIWPLQMLDSTAKLPSGLLKGNGNQLGDYDQCIATNAKVRLESGSIVKVKGKYCLAQVDLKPESDETKLPIHLTQARNFIRSINTDPGHFIPRFTSLNWGVCLPAACDAPEAEFVLRDALRHYNGTIGMRIVINVDPINCYTDDSNTGWSDWMDLPTIGTLVFYTLIIAITAYATISDIISSNDSGENKNESNDESKEKSEEENPPENEESVDSGENEKESGENDSQSSFIKSFSLKQTTAKLAKEASAEGDIECIHGIRALCSLALYVAHKLIPLAMTPFTNRTVLTEISNSPFSVALRASLLYTDSFLLLSGILTAYHMSQDLDRKGSIPWMKRYIARYLRLTPALLAVLLWYSWISDKIGDGPLWGTVVTQNAELCQSNMWQNILYIQNFFPFEEMCATHTHQLALDMQLWWLAPISVWMLRSRPTWALGVLGGFHALTVWLRYSTTQSEFLSLVIYHGITLNQLYRTANLCYSLALHRATPYLAGISLGVLLQQTGKELSLSKFFFIPGWLSCFYFGIWALYTPAHLSMRDYQYNVDEAAQYAALASVAWSLSLSWIIFACFTGNGGPLNSMLCSKPLVFLSRISYAMYLCQFLVFFYNVGSTRTSSEFSLFSAINIMEFIVVIVISTIITILLDIPMQSAKKSIMTIELNFGKQEEDASNDQENKDGETAITENGDVIQEEQIQEEQVELEESTQEEVEYEYDEEQLENQHYEIERDVIYEEEEEEEYDPNMEQEQYDPTMEQEEYEPNMEQYEGDEDVIYEGDEQEQGDENQDVKENNQGEEDDDLQEWEWTNGELCYNPRR